MFNINEIAHKSSFDSKMNNHFEGNCNSNFDFWSFWNGKGSEDISLTIYDKDHNIEQRVNFPDGIITKVHAYGDENITVDFDHGSKIWMMNEGDTRESIKFDNGTIAYNFYDF